MTVDDISRSDTEETQRKRSQTNSSNNADEECPQLAKKGRKSQNTLSSQTRDLDSADANAPDLSSKKILSQWLINDHNHAISSKLPSTLSLDGVATRKTGKDTSKKKTKVGRDLQRLRHLLETHGLRTTKIVSPREAISVYKDSCRMIAGEGGHNDASFRDGKEFLLVTFGIHPQQKRIEMKFEKYRKNAYSVLLLCKRIHEEYCNPQGLSSPKILVDEETATTTTTTTTTETDKDVQRLLRQIKDTNQFLMDHEHCEFPLRLAEAHVNSLIEIAVDIRGQNRYRKEDWRKEYQRICVSNSTASNACIYLLQYAHGICIKDVYFKFNRQESKYERITIYLYDPSIDDGRRPDFFLFLPSLHTILTRGPKELVSDMINSFWTCVIQNGYYPTTKLKDVLEPKLSCFFLSGLTTTSRNSNLPVPLKANFLPRSPLSIYLHGKAGSGKSSLAKVVPTALQETLGQYVDPECMVRFVKQNLNKCIKTLELEFELRPNNNDMSIMSIIQGRRMTMRQSKPGLVVLNLEEMPMYSSENNPDQLSVAQLISQRFGGRKGSYQSEQGTSSGVIGRYKPAPRNADKRSIGKDFSLVTIFTSNYPLAEDSKVALQKLEFYQTLTTIEMSAISGLDRCQFAKSYLRQCLFDSVGDNRLQISTRNIILDISYTDDDTRPLVRQLRIYAYFLQKLLSDSVSPIDGLITVDEIKVAQSKQQCVLTIDAKVGENSARKSQQRLRIGTMRNWYPIGTFVFNPKTKTAMEKLREFVDSDCVRELAIILEFWFSATLAPAVIISRDQKSIQGLMDTIECMGDGIHCLRNVNAQTYKMIKSLYDPKEMPNLRDDILKLGSGALVATELNCPTKDSQLGIREMIEDSPSMTAFSSTKSALYKYGLLFAIHVNGEITPEIMSRVSIII